MRYVSDGDRRVQAWAETRLLENIAIAVPLVMEPTDDSVLTCRLDARSRRASIESMAANSTRRAVHMTAQAGKPVTRRHSSR